MKPFRMPDEVTRLLQRGATVTEAQRTYQRSRLSSRTRVLREANRRGRQIGIVTCAQPISRAEALALAADSAEGRDTYRHCAVPAQWRTVFVRAFVKAAIEVANAIGPVTVSSKYGMP